MYVLCARLLEHYIANAPPSPSKHLALKEASLNDDLWATQQTDYAAWVTRVAPCLATGISRNAALAACSELGT